MALISTSISGTQGVTFVTGALHLTGGLDGAVTTPYIAFETIASGSLTAVGGVTDKLHNRNGVLYFGGTNLESGITVANDSNANGVLTGDGDGTYSNEGNLEFDGTDMLIADRGKIQFGDAGDEYIYSIADNSLGIVSGQSLVLAASVMSSSGYLYTSTGLFTSGHILATGSITAKTSLLSAGTISGSSTLQIVGAGNFVGNVASTGSITAKGALMVTGSTTLMGVLNVTGNLDCNGTITCDDSITIDSITITDTELGYLDGLTLGTVAASKVVTVDSNKDVSSFRNVTATGLLTIASITASSAIMPDDDNTQDLGSPSFRWRNIYTGDLHLANDRGNWTVIEESDFLSLRNNKTGQRFKLEMTLLDPSDGEYGPGNDGKL